VLEHKNGSTVVKIFTTCGTKLFVIVSGWIIAKLQNEELIDATELTSKSVTKFCVYLTLPMLWNVLCRYDTNIVWMGACCKCHREIEKSISS